MIAAAAAGSGLSDPVTLITACLLALAAVTSALTPIVLARRRSRKEAQAASAATTVTSSELALSGWSTLNAALQQEISRLQTVTERMQARIDLLEQEIVALQKLAMPGRKESSGA